MVNRAAYVGCAFVVLLSESHLIVIDISVSNTIILLYLRVRATCFGLFPPSSGIKEGNLKASRHMLELFKCVRSRKFYNCYNI